METPKKVTHVMKYEIQYNKELYKLLREIQYKVWRIKNKSTTIANDWQQFSFGYNERFGDFPKEKDITGTTLTTDVRKNVAEFGTLISSSIVATSSKEAVEKFKNSKNDIINGRGIIPSYRRDGSFPIRVSQIKNITKVNNKTYDAKFSLLSREGAKQQGVPTQTEVTLKTGGSAKDILEKVISGEYKMCDSRINNKKNKFYLLMVYQHEVNPKKLDENRIMGIDLGIKVPAMLAINDEKYYKIPVGSGKEINSFRNQIRDRKRRMQQQRKWCGEGSIGHGTKTRIKPLQKLRDKEANFNATKNHNFSRYIVDEAVKNNCGVIQMEDLTGIAEGEKKGTFLGNWTYFDLQEKIKYKAEEVGIKVVKIKPDYTSQRCNHCGNIHKENRNAKVSQEKFKCVVCEHEANADVNASKNIAMAGIEDIIKDQLKAQEQAYAHAMKYSV